MSKKIYTSFDELPLMFTVTQVHDILGISQAGAYELVRSKGSPAFKVGSRILIPSPRTGTYWSPDCIGRVHKKLLKNAGIDENVRFHDLRHTFATVALQSGIDVKTVSNMLGHYSAGFTLDTYTHVPDQMQKAAAQRIQGVMDAALPNEQPVPPPDNTCKVIEFKKAVNS